MKRVYITGTAGFIGFHLAKEMLSHGFLVQGFDGFTDYYDVKLKRDRNAILLENKNFSSTEGLLEDKENLLLEVEKFKPDIIVHLAAQAGVRYSLENPRAYIDSNIIGSFNVMEVASECNVKHLMMASTSSVYGLSNQVPFSEKTSIDTPISPYATTKRTCELMCHTYYSLYGLKCRILRFFTVYGPWGRPDMALFLFTKAMINNEHIKVFNNGNMQRDFTYIDDIVKGFISAIKSDYPFEIFNLGYGRTVELLDFIKILEFNLNVKAKKIMLPIQPGDVPSTWSDISKAKKMLNYNPQNDVKIGIKNFVDWYLEYYKD